MVKNMWCKKLLCLSNPIMKITLSRSNSNKFLFHNILRNWHMVITTISYHKFLEHK